MHLLDELRSCGAEVLAAYQKRSSLKQQHLVCLYDLSEVPQVSLKLLDVRDELVDDTGPGLGEREV